MEKQIVIFIDNLYGVALMTFKFNSQGDLLNVNETFSYNNRRKNREKEFRLKFRKYISLESKISFVLFEDV